MKMLDCIVLAGGEKGGLAEQEGVAGKALIELAGKEMVCYVLDILCAMEEVERVVLVGPRDKLLFLTERYPVEVVAEQGSIPQNLLAAASCLNSGRHAMVSSADIPMLTRGAVDDFLNKCRPFDSDFYYPISPQDKIENRFPGMQRTYVTLQEGTFTGGNIFLANTALIASAVPALERFLANRKNPLKMVSLLGTGFALKFLTKKLTIAELEKRFSSLLNLKACAVVSDYAEISFDVDKSSDLELARHMIAGDK